MSMCYWICQGIGIRANQLRPFLNTQKCVQLLKEQLPGIEISAEVHERVIKAVLRLCDMTREQVEALIDDDIYDYGCG